MASKEFISKLKDSIDIVELVSEAVELRRSGKYLTGLSPFTKEKTPSFFVNPESQTFHCFSSNQGGDIITFIELTKGFSFHEALKLLADRAGLPFEAENKTPEQIAKDRAFDEEKKLLFKLNRFAARFYQEQFEGSSGAVAREYALKRELTNDSLLAFGIGFAPDSWTALRDYFLKIKAPLLKAHQLGLFRTKGNEKPKEDGSNLFDTFRNRLLFPIRDLQGEVLGFGGRWMGPSSADAPKYLNSPESIVYEKERVLYNLDLARKSIRETGSVVLVEGYMDCIALYQRGFTNVVANCGTALTKPQATMLRKLAPKVICLYDSDAAGVAASERAMNLFLESEGVPLLGAQLPDGKDPDEFLRTHGDAGVSKMAEILQNSPAMLDTWIQNLVSSAAKNLQARTEALDKIASKLAKLRDDLSIQTRIPGVALSLEMDVALVGEALRKHKKGFSPIHSGARSGQGATAKNGPTAPHNSSGNFRREMDKSKQFQVRNDKRSVGTEHGFLSDLLKNREWVPELRKMHAQDCSAVLPYLFSERVRKLVEEILDPLADGESEEQRFSMLQEKHRENSEVRSLFTGAAFKLDGALPAKSLEVALARLRGEALKRETQDIQSKIKTAEKIGDIQTSESLLLKLTELQRQQRILK